MTTGIYDWTGIEYRDLDAKEIHTTLHHHSTTGLSATLRKNLVDLEVWAGRALGPVNEEVCVKIRNNISGVAKSLGWDAGIARSGKRNAAYSTLVEKNGADEYYVFVVRRGVGAPPKAIAIE